MKDKFPAAFNKLNEIEKEANDLKDKIEAFNSSINDYQEQINELLNNYEIELVIYDEIENFRDWSDPEFYYPY